MSAKLDIDEIFAHKKIKKKKDEEEENEEEWFFEGNGDGKVVLPHGDYEFTSGAS